MTPLSRRTMIGGLGCACCAGLVGNAAHARISPLSMKPLIGPSHRPVDADEKGLWSQYERVEADIAGSNLLIRDPALIAYLVSPGKDGGKAFWQRCGAAWPNKKGGFQLRLNAMPIGGELVLLPPSAGNTGAA